MKQSQSKHKPAPGPRSAPSLEELIARTVDRMRPIPSFHEVEEAVIAGGTDLEAALQATLGDASAEFAAFGARREMVINAIMTHLPPAVRKDLDGLLDHLEAREVAHADLGYRLGLALGRRLGVAQ
jgi:hypothetical protein